MRKIYGLNAVNIITLTLYQILTVPFFLHYLGMERYEKWTLLSALGFTCLILDFGMIVYSSNAARIAYGMNNPREAQEHIGYGAFFFVFSFSAFALAAIVSLSFNPFDEGPVFALILLNVPFYQFKSWLSYILTARVGQKYELVFYISITLIQLTLYIAVVMLGGGFLALAIAQITSNLLCGILPILYALHRYAPDISVAPLPVPRQKIKEVVKGCLANFGYSATSAAIIHLPIILLGFIPRLPTGTLATFTVSRTLTGLVRQFCQQMARSSGIEISRFLAPEHKHQMQRLFLTGSTIISVLAAVGMGGLLPVADLVLNLWTRKHELYDPVVINLFGIAGLLSAQVQLPMTLPQFSNRADIVIRPLFLQVILMVVLGLTGAYFFAAPGMIVALSIAELSTQGTISVRRIIPEMGLRSGRFLSITGAASLLGFVLSYGAAYAGRLLAHPLDFSGLVLTGIVWSLLILPAAALFYKLARRYEWRHAPDKTA